jgi:hypothetical protein
MSDPNAPPLADDPIFGNARIGLAVMEVQTLHYGHLALLNWMRAACGKRIVALGSSELAGQPGHPFTYGERKVMIEAVFGVGTFTFVSLNDIDSTLPDDWLDYVHARIRAASQPRPTDYFSGSRHDARWYEGDFCRIEGAGELTGPGRSWYDAGTARAIHILDREKGDQPSGRNIRELIERREADWQRYVPPILWRFIEQRYPGELRVALRGKEPPTSDAYPVGTRFKSTEEGSPLLARRDDGKWRPLRTRPDEKSDFARQQMARRT